MINNNHETPKIPEGYKQTEVGIIPEGWEVLTLHEMAKANGLVRGPFGGALKKEIFTDRGYKVYEQRNAIYSTTDIGSYFIDEYKFSELNRFSIKPGDFIISCSGTIGKIYQLPIDAPQGVINQALLKVSLRDDINHTYFLKYFKWHKFQEKIIDGTQGGAMKNLVGMDEFRNSVMAFPQLKTEQTAIANALSDVDTLITELEKLIAKKEAIKTGAMQQLLTGKTRLPQFDTQEDGTLKGYKDSELGKIPEDWEVVSISEIADINMGQSPNSSNYNKLGVGLPLVQGNADIFNRKTIIRNYTSEITKRANLGDLILSVRAPVGEVAIAIFDCCIGRGVCSLKYPNNYLYHWLVFFEDKWEQFSKGSTFDSINSDDLKKIELFIPDSNEQIAIAKVLSDMDSEIEALEKRLEKTKSLKQGMMQELLTGRTRLV